MAELLITPSQTIGPFFKEGLAWPHGERLFSDAAPGRRVRLRGRLTDHQDRPVADALLEFWQPDAAGRFGAERKGASAGFGRVQTGDDGGYAISTIVPGQVASAAGTPQAPHILVLVFARGLLRQLLTRVYFEGEAANAGDAVLALCGARATTLIARREAANADTYVWDISLQGARETVFFEA
jgi:protocatechuate 3,4-dioxygenase, alpha subunit